MAANRKASTTFVSRQRVCSAVHLHSGVVLPRHLACARLALIAALGLQGCGQNNVPPRPQWLIEVQTDAPIPLVGDRVLIELLDDAGKPACPACWRNATATHESDWPVSFGVEATPKALYLRTRLYRGDHVDPATGQPDPGTSIDSLARLPVLGGHVVRIYVGLRLECLGKKAITPLDLPDGGTSGFSSCVDEFHDGEPVPGASMSAPDMAPGSSKLLDEVRPTACSQPTVPGMVCVQGGVFFMGSTMAPAPHSDVEATPTPERLVGVSTFLIDSSEVSVDDFRQYAQDPSYPAKAGGDCPEGVKCSDGTSQLGKFCTYPTAKENGDGSLPMNCLTWTVARGYCRFRNKRLPTEAEWEYVASNGARDTRFPWGNDTPNCQRSVLARAGDAGSTTRGSAECSPPKDAGPAPVTGQGPGDIQDKTLGGLSTGGDDAGVWGAGVLNMGGNVAEWTADRFESYRHPAADGGSCWVSPKVVLVAPTCSPQDPPPTIATFSVRGGSWRDSLETAWTANRSHASISQLVPYPDIGLRCACSFDSDTGGCAPLTNNSK